MINTALRSTRACNSGFRRPSIGKELRSGENLWPIETLQYSVHARTCSPPARHWRDRELFTSRVLSPFGSLTKAEVRYSHLAWLAKSFPISPSTRRC